MGRRVNLGPAFEKRVDAKAHESNGSINLCTLLIGSRVIARVCPPHENALRGIRWRKEMAIAYGTYEGGPRCFGDPYDGSVRLGWTGISDEILMSEAFRSLSLAAGNVLIFMLRFYIKEFNRGSEAKRLEMITKGIPYDFSIYKGDGGKCEGSAFDRGRVAVVRAGFFSINKPIDKQRTVNWYIASDAWRVRFLEYADSTCACAAASTMDDDVELDF